MPSAFSSAVCLCFAFEGLVCFFLCLNSLCDNILKPLIYYILYYDPASALRNLKLLFILLRKIGTKTEFNDSTYALLNN